MRENRRKESRMAQKEGNGRQIRKMEIIRKIVIMTCARTIG